MEIMKHIDEHQQITVSELMHEYLAVHGVKKWAPNTYSCNLHRINHYILPYIGNLKINQLTTFQLEVFYNQLLQEPAVPLKGREHEQRTVSFSVVERVHAILRSALNQAIRWGYLTHNPALAVELPQHIANKRAVWTATEVKKTLELCEDVQLKMCMLLSIGCSLRIGEILGLRWEDVHIEHLDEAFLDVKQILQRCDIATIEKLRMRGKNQIFYVFPSCKSKPAKTVLVLKSPKTKSSVRRVYLPRTVAQAILEFKDKQANEKRCAGVAYHDCGLVIANTATGRPIEERIISKKLKKFIKKNGLRPVVFHSFRHTSVDIKLRASGGDIKAVQGDTGHSQSDMVTEVYASIVDEDRKELAKKMEETFFMAMDGDRGSDTEEQVIRLIHEKPELADAILRLIQVICYGAIK